MRKILLIVLLAGFAVLPLAAEGGEIEANDLGFSFSAGAPLFGEAGLSPDGALVTGYGVGLVYHPLTFLSVEPSFLFYKTDKEKDVSTGTDNGEKREQTLLGFCLGVFYYGDLGAGLYYYAGPRVTYYKNEYERTYEQNNNDSFSETQQMIYSLAAGLKYMLSDRFSFFCRCRIWIY